MLAIHIYFIVITVCQHLSHLHLMRNYFHFMRNEVVFWGTMINESFFVLNFSNATMLLWLFGCRFALIRWEAVFPQSGIWCEILEPKHWRRLCCLTAVLGDQLMDVCGIEFKRLVAFQGFSHVLQSINSWKDRAVPQNLPLNSSCLGYRSFEAGFLHPTIS